MSFDAVTRRGAPLRAERISRSRRIQSAYFTPSLISLSLPRLKRLPAPACPAAIPPSPLSVGSGSAECAAGRRHGEADGKRERQEGKERKEREKRGKPLRLQRPNNYAIHSRNEAEFVLVASRVSPVVVAIISLFR